MVSEPEPCHCARQEILDDDIGASHQLPRRGETFGIRQIEGDRFLVAVHAQEIGGFRPRPGRTPATGVVAGFRAFDLDYFRTEIREQHRRVRPGQDPAEVGDDQAVERTGHRKAAEPVSALPMVS